MQVPTPPPFSSFSFSARRKNYSRSEIFQESAEKARLSKSTIIDSPFSFLRRVLHLRMTTNRKQK